MTDYKALAIGLARAEVERSAFVNEGGRICRCGAWVFEGDGCDTCDLRTVDTLAQEGYSPDIEHFKGKGYRVAVWPQGPRAPLIEIGWAKTWNEVNAMLVSWRPA